MMANCSSVLAVTKISPSNVLLRMHSRLPIDSMYKTPNTKLFPRTDGVIFNSKSGMQRANHLVRAEKEVKQTRQKTYYNIRPYGPTYSEGEQVLVLFQTVNKQKTEILPVFTEIPTLSWKLLTIEIFVPVMTDRRKL